MIGIIATLIIAGSAIGISMMTKNNIDNKSIRKDSKPVKTLTPEQVVRSQEENQKQSQEDSAQKANDADKWHLEQQSAQ